MRTTMKPASLCRPVRNCLPSRGWAWLVALAVAAVMLPRCLAADPPARPNVVIIFCDDLGYGDLGVYGARGYATPNLDRMASEGNRLTRFYVAQAVCSASRAALLTGCYSNRVGIRGALGPGSKVGINADEMTLAELVKQRDYATAVFGKWHLGDSPQFLPTRHGFDEYFGLPYSNDMWPLHPGYLHLPPEQRKRQGYPDLPLIEAAKVAITPVTPKEQSQLTTWYTERAVRFIERNARTGLLALRGPQHAARAAARQREISRQDPARLVRRRDRGDRLVGGRNRSTRSKTNGLDEHTLVIFTSDNGPWLYYGDHAGSAGPLREGKGTMLGRRLPRAVHRAVGPARSRRAQCKTRRP